MVGFRLRELRVLKREAGRIVILLTFCALSHYVLEGTELPCPASVVWSLRRKPLHGRGLELCP